MVADFVLCSVNFGLAGQLEKKSKKCRGIGHTPLGLGFWCNAQNPGLAAQNRVIFGVCEKTALENFVSGKFLLWKNLEVWKILPLETFLSLEKSVDKKN